MDIKPFSDAEYETLPELFAFLEPQLPRSEVIERCNEMRASGWFCVGAYGDSLQAMAGLSLRTHLFSGRVAFVENVVVLPEFRGRGLGQMLMAWIEHYARERGCRMVTLDAYQTNLPARAFYERLGYDPRGVHFVREL